MLANEKLLLLEAMAKYFLIALKLTKNYRKKTYLKKKVKPIIKIKKYPLLIKKSKKI